MRLNHLRNLYKNYSFYLNNNVNLENNSLSAWYLISFDVEYSSG